MKTQVVAPIATILVGCMSNVVFLECIIKRDPAAGNLITISQFTFVALQGLVGHIQFDPYPSLKARTIPLWVYVALTAIFFSVSVVNNMALNYNISLPLHMVFRASSLVASLVLGFLFFGKRYSVAQTTGVLLVTVGIGITTFADSQAKLAPECCGANSPEEHLQDDGEVDLDHAPEFWRWVTGIFMLTAALFGSAFLGQIQEWSYRKWDRNASESKFYSHMLALPFFYLFTASDIVERFAAWIDTETTHEYFQGSDPAFVSLLPDVPILFVFLLGNVATQYVCISGVYALTAHASTLACTMTITVRKFLSLVLSVWYFSNPFSKLHWLGTVFVFFGVLQYSEVLSAGRPTDRVTKRKDS